MISARVHKTRQEILLAACDSELLEDEAMELSRGFYHEETIDGNRLLELFEECTTSNLLGSRTVEALLEKYPRYKEAVVELKGSPHLLTFEL